MLPKSTTKRLIYLTLLKINIRYIKVRYKMDEGLASIVTPKNYSEKDN